MKMKDNPTYCRSSNYLDKRKLIISEQQSIWWINYVANDERKWKKTKIFVFFV